MAAHDRAVATFSNRQLYGVAQRWGLDTRHVTAVAYRSPRGDAHSRSCLEWGYSGKVGTGTPQELTLTALAAERLPVCCKLELAHCQDRLTLVSLTQAERLIASVERRIARGEVGGGTGRIEQVARDVRQAQFDLRAAGGSIARSAAGTQAAEQLIERLEESAEKLKESRRSGAARRELGHQIWDALHPPRTGKHPPRTAREPAAPDAAPWLVGVTPLRWPPNKATAEMLATFTLHTTEEHVVLAAPRFVLDWLHRQCSANSTWATTVYVSAAPAPDHEALCALAAQLWDPCSEGPLATMAGALEASSALIAPAA